MSDSNCNINEVLQWAIYNNNDGTFQLSGYITVTYSLVQTCF